MKRPFIWILTLGWMASLSAQTLSLDSCRQLAMERNAAVKNAALDVLAAREVEKQVFTKYFPNVSLTAGGYYALNPLIEYTIDDISNAAARQWLNNLYHEYGAALGIPNEIALCERGTGVGLTVVQPVFMGGQIVNGNRLAAVGTRAAELQAALVGEQLCLQVEENYWLVVSLIEKRQTLLQAITLLDTLFRDASTAHSAGLITQNDLLKITLKQQEMQSNRLKVEDGIRLASMALCQTIGVPYSEGLTLTDSARFDGATEPNIDAAHAVSGRKEAELLRLQLEAEQLRKRLTLGGTLPQVMVGMSLSYGNLIFDKYSANGLAFATLRVPITDWWETSHKLKQQRYIIEKAENQRNDLEEKMMLETLQAWNHLQETVAQVELSESIVRDATLNLERSRTEYEAGLVAISELLEAQTLLRQALDQRTDARIQYQLGLSRYRTLTHGMPRTHGQD